MSLGITTLLYFPAGLLFLLGALLSTPERDYGAADTAAAADSGELLLPERSVSTVMADGTPDGASVGFTVCVGDGESDGGDAGRATSHAGGGVAGGKDAVCTADSVTEAAEVGSASVAGRTQAVASGQSEAEHANLLPNAQQLASAGGEISTKQLQH